MDHKMIAHVWAKQSKPRAQGFSVFFEGDTIYSYGRHFPIARHIVNAKGDKAVLFTSRSYSVSTSKHVSFTRGALRGDCPVFTVSDPSATPDPAAMRAECAARLVDALTKAARARTNVEWYIGAAEQIILEANQFAAFFGRKWRLEMPADRAAALADARKRAVLADARKAAETRKQHEAARVRFAGELEKWRRGEPANVWGSPDTALRIVGDQVQTSRGAEFPVEHAKRAFRLIAACQAKGAGWSRNGHTIHLGHFQIDKIKPSGDVKAGCHLVKWSEIVRVAALLDLISAAA